MTVKVYSRSSCAPCQTLKYWLNKRKIDYSEIDIDDSEYRIAPTLEIDGQIIQGLNFTYLTQLLGL